MGKNTIYIIDTSIFTNILDVPSKNGEREKVLKDFKEYIALDVQFVIPMSTIIETGNHIAQNGDGNRRRTIAKEFSEQVKKAIDGEAPYKIISAPNNESIREWIEVFPELAGQNKVTKKGEKREGTSLGDLIIIQEYKRLCKLAPNAEVRIWSLDSGFEACNPISLECI